MFHLLVDQGDLTPTIKFEFDQLTLEVSHLVALLQVLNVGRCAFSSQSLQSLKNLGFQPEVRAGGDQLFAIEIKGPLTLQAFELQLFLFLDDLGAFFGHALLQGDELFSGAFLVEANQQLAFLHPIAAFHQNLLHNTACGDPDFFHVAHRFKFAHGHHHFLRAGNGQPANAEHSGSDQRPGDAFEPEPILLQDTLVVGERAGSSL